MNYPFRAMGLILFFALQVGSLAFAVMPEDDPDLLPLTEGLREIGSSQAIVCSVAELHDSTVAVVFGDADAFSDEVPINGYPVLLRTTKAGRGRVAALGHESFACHSLPEKDNSRMIVNTIRYLDRLQTKKILIDKGHNDWLDLNAGLVDSLSNHGFQVVVHSGKLNTTALTGIGVVLIGNAWGDYALLEYEAVESFVHSGGGLFLLGLGWSWVAYNPGRTLDDYPMNRFAVRFGMRFRNDTIKDPSNNFGDIAHVIFHLFYPLKPIREVLPYRPYRVIIDQSHDYSFLWDWQMGPYYLAPVGAKYSRNMATLDSNVIADIFKYDAIMIPQAYSDAVFSDGEIATIKRFVERGGGLLLVGVAIGKPDASVFPMHRLAEVFGIRFNHSGDVLKQFRILPHDITQGVTEYQSEASVIGSVTLTSDWTPFLTDSRNNIIAAARSYGEGRVVVVADHFLINFSATHNQMLVANVTRWLCKKFAGGNSSFIPPDRIMPENTLNQGLVTFLFAENMRQRVQFLSEQYETVTRHLRRMMAVDCIYDLNIVALATGGGGYSSGKEIGIGLLTSNAFALEVFAHELTHSWQHPGGEVPWMGEGWAILAAHRVCMAYGGDYAKFAQQERDGFLAKYKQYDPMGKSVDLTEYGTDRMSVPNEVYIGKTMTIIEDLETKYGADVMQRYFLLRRKYYQPALHGAITTQKIIHFLSWAAGRELFTYFRSKRTLVDPQPVGPVVFYTQPATNDTLFNNAQAIQIVFNTRLKAATLNEGTVLVNGSISGAITGTVTYVDSARMAIFTPFHPFRPGEKITVTITNGVQDLSGNPLDGNGNQLLEMDDSYRFEFIVASEAGLDFNNRKLAPTSFGLEAVYPNPFNHSTTITFHLKVESSVVLQVLNTRGQVVMTLVANKKYPKGTHKILWMAKELPSGLYLIRLQTEDDVACRKALYIR